MISENAHKKILVEVPLSDLSDRNINPRVKGVDEENVQGLMAGSPEGNFEAIHLGLFNNELITADGYHRIAATKRLGLDTILAFIVEYDSEEELLKQAFRANVNHGKRLSNEDIATNLYRFFVEKVKVDASVAKTKIGRDYGFTNERIAKAYINWGIVSIECLGLASIENISVAKAEELFTLVAGEKAGEISEEAKENVKNVWFKYGAETKSRLREACKWAKEGKDLIEEEEKAEALAQAQALEVGAEKIDPVDSVEGEGDDILAEAFKALGSDTGVNTEALNEASTAPAPTVADAIAGDKKEKAKIASTKVSGRSLVTKLMEATQSLSYYVTKDIENIEITDEDIKGLNFVSNALAEIKKALGVDDESLEKAKAMAFGMTQEEEEEIPPMDDIDTPPAIDGVEPVEEQELVAEVEAV